jgi:L-aspartate oxidase
MKRPEYLVSFDTSKVPSFTTDVLIIGSGIAGLRAAIEAAKHHKITLLTKDGLSETNTYYAQGGIASQIDKPSLVSSHIADTLNNAHQLANPSVIKQVINKGITLVKELVSWGVEFDKKGKRFDMAREGGHSFSRILHSGGDATGRHLQKTLIRKVRATNNITIFDYTFVIDILAYSRTCHGALVYNQKSAALFVIWAKKTIIATGGAGQLYRETTNPQIATGDGVSIAYRKGVTLQDLEFVQFHPTALYVAGAARYLISEAVRGEGGILLDRYQRRFMADYHPLKELAPRDILSRAILNQMKLTRDTNVYLDLRHLPSSKIRKRFPSLAKLCKNFGIDTTRELIPVRPSAHYLIGGIKIDLFGRTNIKNLFVAGECASSSFHGANRLGSNSLLEAVVIGYFAGKTASREVRPQKIPYLTYVRRYVHGKVNLTDITNSLRSLMWYNVGLERNETGLKQALAKIDYWSSYCLSLEFSSPQGWELQNMLTLARLITQSALKRIETRGVHYRTDFPLTVPEWEKHSVI